MDNTTQWVVELDSGVFDKPLRITLNNPIIIGRVDQTQDGNIAVDLAPYNGAAKGVSRQHLRLFTVNNKVVVQDLETPNGTMLNDKRLQPDQVYPVADGDSLVLGTFRLTIHLSQGATSTPAATPASAEDEGDEVEAPDDNTAHKTVLIVEDHTEVAQLFSLVLQKNNYDTHISRDANRAMRYLRTSKPAAVILDLMLPGMSGIEVCRYIRRDATLDRTAIIFVSANRNPGTERAAYDAGADAFISKPIEADKLATVIEEQIRRRRAGEEPTHELQDKDNTKALSDQNLPEMSPTVRDDTIAVVVAGYTDRPFTVTLNKPITLGRGPYKNPADHVDLSRFNAKDKGVSRVHAKLLHENDRFYLQDLDSLNGTYIDGRRLSANQTVEIKSGQNIRVGQLGMNVYFATD